MFLNSPGMADFPQPVAKLMTAAKQFVALPAQFG
jgi:hypothetical protein